MLGMYFRVVILFFCSAFNAPSAVFQDGALADDFVVLPSIIMVFHCQFWGVLKK